MALGSFLGIQSPYSSDYQRNLALAASVGLLSGANQQQQIGNAAQSIMPVVLNQQQQQKALDEQNKTLQYLEQTNPQLAAQVRAGMPVSQAWAQVIEAQKPKKPNYINAGNGLLFNSDTQQWVQAPDDMRQNQAEYGLTPQTAVDKDGNPVLIQVGKNGQAVQTKMPDGLMLSKTPIKLDAGNKFILIDPVTRQPVGEVAKDLAGAERDKARGEQEGKNLAAAPADLQAGMNAKMLIEELKNDPNREQGTGLSSFGNWLPSTAGYDYQNKVNQAKSGAFLTAIQQMRGLGALSNSEGQAATAAVTRMDTATSEEAFVEALNAYEKIIDQGIARAQSRMGNPTIPGPAQPNSGMTKSGIKFSVEGQ